MGKKLETDIVINLAGNLANKARQYGNSMSDFAKKNDKAMLMVNRSVAAAGRGIDTLGNRFVGAAIAMGTGVAANQFANLDRRLSRLAISADITTDKAKELYDQIRQVSNEEGIRIDPKEALSAVEEILTKTGDLDFAIKNLPNMAAVIQASGASGQNVGGIFTEFKKLAISGSEEAMVAIDTLNKQGKSGAFTLASLANYGPQLFAAYAATGRQGTQAVTELGAAIQVIRDGFGSDAEAVTGFNSIIRDITRPDTAAFLKRNGIDVFDPEKLKKGVEQMRPLSDLMKEIVIGSEGLSEKLKPLNLTDEAKKALNPLLAVYSQTGKVDVFDKFMKITGDGSATLKDAAIAGGDLAASLQRINNEVERASNSVFAGPFKEIADAINGIDQNTIDNWLKWASVAVVAVGTVVAAKKAAGWGKDIFGGKGKNGKGGAGGSGGFADMGVMPVYVVNMGAGGMGNGIPDITNAGESNKKGTSKINSVLGTLGKAFIVGSVAEGFFGDTDFAKWAKKTTHLEKDLFPSIFGENIREVGDKGRTNSDITSMVNSINGQLNLKLDLTDNRAKLTVVNRPPFMTVDPDMGLN
ncbi:hypothetical protein ACRN91_14320 [Shewanella baltica]|uniref:hypothetical protein n=1 Tax=Shewanella baltica TaxID=62322 RepID=UPI003D79625D